MKISKSAAKLDAIERVGDGKMYRQKNLMSATYYNQNSKKVPLYYSRPGPGSYQHEKGGNCD